MFVLLCLSIWYYCIHLITDIFKCGVLAHAFFKCLPVTLLFFIVYFK
uniref:Uncharacterized protein n=1 Tax=Arundo donax TaxID=35708 RepID=A0A0A9HNB7_ARUDO